MRKILSLTLLLLLAACSPGRSKPTASIENTATAPTPTMKEPVRAQLDDLGPAPELENKIWLNSQGPLHLRDLGGKVVLLEMWTFG